MSDEFFSPEMWLLHEEKDFIQHIHIFFFKIKYLMSYDSGKKTKPFFFLKM